MARLILNADTPQAREYVLKQGANSIGRAEANDFTIADPSVSGSHCQVIVSNGTVQLRDLGSTNGTFVGGARVTEAELKGNEKVQLGAVQLMFEADGGGTTVKPVIAILRATTPVAAAAPTALRVSGAPAKPPPIVIPQAESELVVTEAEPASRFSASSNATCKYHPRTLARWICNGCGKTYCDLCVADRHTSHGDQKFCRSCGGMASAVDVTYEPPKERSFFRELPGAFIYPFKGAGVVILAFATVLFAAIDFFRPRTMVGITGLITGLVLTVVAGGYLYAYMQSILHSTASEDDQMPQLPPMEDLMSSFFRLLGTVLISFGPAMVLAYLAIAQQQPMAGVALIPAMIFGTLYLPMAFMAVAMKDNVLAANPLIVVPSICCVPLEYLVTAILVAGIFGIRWMGDALTSQMAGASMMGTSVTEMLLLFALRAVWAFVSIYLLTATTRVLGLLYVTKRERLGW